MPAFVRFKDTDSLIYIVKDDIMLLETNKNT